MECRSCKESLDGGVEHRMVAEWPFCMPCFERLMVKPAEVPAEQQPADSTVQPAEARAVARAAPVEPVGEAVDVNRCSLCDAPIEAGATPASLGPWRFCAPCAEARLGGNSKPAVEEPPEQEQPAGEEPALAARRPVACAGCGRRIPAGGAKPIDDEPFCPACYTERAPTPPPIAEPVVESAATEPAQPKGPASRVRVSVARPEPAAEQPTSQPSEDEPAAEGHCHACGLPVSAGERMVVEGFALCAACRETEPELALKVARARHRRLLERLARELG